MARFRFPYANVLRFRELKEREAEQRQWRAHHHWQQCLAQEQALQERIRLTAAGLEQRLAVGQSLEAWLGLYRQVDRLQEQLKVAQQGSVEATRALQEASVLRSQAAQAAEVLRHLRDRQAEEHKLLLTKKEQRFLDEVGIQRWNGASPTASDLDGERLS